MRILVDADACPEVVKELLFRASDRLKVELVLVANQVIKVPPSKYIRSVAVSEGPDEADNHIVEMMDPGDLIISADIPLADRVIKRQGVVLDPRGIFLTEGNIGERLALRDLMDGLRADGLNTGGPGAYGNKEKRAFANQLDRFLTKARKSGHL